MSDEFIVNDETVKHYGELEDRETYNYDNSILEYKPVLEREEREREAWLRSSLNNETSIGQKKSRIGDGVVTDVIKRYKVFKDKIDKKMEDILRIYGEKKIVFPEKTNEDVKRALEDLGIEGDFTFKDYAETLSKRNTAAGDFLVELSERQFENLDGDIKMELFHDYYEIKKEIEITEQYLYRQSTGKMFSNIDTEEDDWEDKLLKEELSWKERKTQIDNLSFTREEMLKDAFLYNPEIYQFQKSVKLKEEPELKRVRTEENQLKDAIHISENKINNSEYLFDIIEEVELLGDSLGYKKTLEQVVDHALEDDTKESNLTQLKQMLTISTEKSNEEKHHYKNTLRNVYNEDFLNKNLDELSIYNELYENSIIPLTSVLKFYNEPQDENTTMLLESITSSMLTSRKEQKKKTRDFDSLNFATYSIRMKKTRETESKEKQRQTYKVLDEIVENLKQGGE